MTQGESTSGAPRETLTVVVIDDEALARRHLSALVAGVPWATNVGEASDGAAALALIDAARPDVVFLDVEMPELPGTAVAERLAYAPAVIFTTAYHRYAVAAFELEAVDYLLKPFGQRRFDAAIERARRFVEGRRAAAAGTTVRAATEAPVDRLFVRTPQGILPLPVAEVERLEADDDYVVVHARGRRHVITARLGELAAQLDPRRFLQVHRSHVVNLDYVAALEPYDAARLQVRMRDGRRIVASRARSQHIRRIAK